MLYTNQSSSIMKKILVLFLLLNNLFILSGQNDECVIPKYDRVDTLSNDEFLEWKFYYINNKQIAKQRFYKDGGLSMCSVYDTLLEKENYISWYRNGQIQQQFQYENDKYYGVNNYSYTKNGDLRARIININDTIITTKFYPSKKIEYISKGVYGSLGLIELFYKIRFCENGKTSFVDSSGIEQKTFIQYSCSGNGYIISSINKKGAFIGKMININDEGNTHLIGFYKNYDGILQEQIGIWSYFYDNGKLHKEELYDNNGNGEIIKEQIYNKKGKLIEVYLFNDKGEKYLSTLKDKITKQERKLAKKHEVTLFDSSQAPPHSSNSVNGEEKK